MNDENTRNTQSEDEEYERRYAEDIREFAANKAYDEGLEIMARLIEENSPTRSIANHNLNQIASLLKHAIDLLVIEENIRDRGEESRQLAIIKTEVEKIYGFLCYTFDEYLRR